MPPAGGPSYDTVRAAAHAFYSMVPPPVTRALPYRMPGRRLVAWWLLRGDDPDRLAVEEAANVLDDVRIVALVILLADVAEMRGQHDIVELAERVIGGQRLDVEDVEARAGDLLVLERLEQRAFDDDRPARGVDQVGRLLHQPEFARGDEAAVALAELHVDRQEVGVPEQVVLRDVFDTDLLAALGREILAPGDALHAERLADAGRPRAELAEAEKAQRLAL